MFSILISAHEKSGNKIPVLQWLKNQSEESQSIMPVIITIVLAVSRSIYMIWLTYQLHHPTCINVFQMAILLFKSQTKDFH